TPAGGSPLDVGSRPVSIVVADFNGDHHPDLAVLNSGDRTVSVLLGDGSGDFSAASGSPYAALSDPAFSPTSMVTGEFNGDSHLDLAIAGLWSSPTYGQEGIVSVLS